MISSWYVFPLRLLVAQGILVSLQHHGTGHWWCQLIRKRWEEFSPHTCLVSGDKTDFALVRSITSILWFFSSANKSAAFRGLIDSFCGSTIREGSNLLEYYVRNECGKGVKKWGLLARSTGWINGTGATAFHPISHHFGQRPISPSVSEVSHWLMCCWSFLTASLFYHRRLQGVDSQVFFHSQFQSEMRAILWGSAPYPSASDIFRPQSLFAPKTIGFSAEGSNERLSGRRRRRRTTTTSSSSSYQLW